MHEEQEREILSKSSFEPIVTNTIEVDELLKTEATLLISGTGGQHEVVTCYGDIIKLVNAAMDYANLLEAAIAQWSLTGFHEATYDYHAKKLREIARKYGASIDYDYDAAVEKCKQKNLKRQKQQGSSRDDGVGEEALLLGYQKAKREAEARTREQQQRQAAEEGAEEQ